MLEDSQRDNTDLKACACEEQSVVIMNTPDQNVNVITELVFDMMLHSELEVTGRSIDSILNMITDMTPQPDAARRKSDEDSAAVQRGSAMISARNSDDSQQAQDVQPQPMQDATVRMKLGVWIVCEDRRSEFHHNGTAEHTFDIPRKSNSSTRARRSL